jgi:hypothetical protein
MNPSSGCNRRGSAGLWGNQYGPRNVWHAKGPPSYALHLQRLWFAHSPLTLVHWRQAEGSPKTMLPIYQYALRYIPQHPPARNNKKSHECYNSTTMLPVYLMFAKKYNRKCNLKVGCLHPVACTRLGSGFPSNATLVWIFYLVTQNDASTQHTNGVDPPASMWDVNTTRSRYVWKPDFA